MAQFKDKTHDPLKNGKSVHLCNIKSNELLRFIIKTALIFFVVVSIPLACYFIASIQWHRLGCSILYSDLQNTSRMNRFSNEDEQTNISHIVFGIGGSAKTWSKRRRYCELWWRPNVTRGYVWLDQDPPAADRWPDTLPEYRISANTSRFNYTSRYGSRSAVRIARIVKESFELGLKNVRWFVMGDDDTVFFTENLVRLLRKYDHEEMYYIGGNSESVEQDVVHSYGMAYGGGGFAVSYPLAAELAKLLDGCINRYASFYGSDQKIQACMDEIGVPVTREPGFHQMDIQGDPYGLLASHPVAPAISLHHLDYLKSLFPAVDRVEAVERLHRAYGSDPGRILQRSFCYNLNKNWSVVVSWGYTIQLYPSLVNAKTLETALQTFLTWKKNSKPFTFNTRPIENDPCKRPLVFYLDRVEENRTGGTVTTYTAAQRVGDCRQKPSTVRRFNISAALLEPDYWKKPPRRQCCDVMDGGDGAAHDIRVQVRACGRGESLTPP